LQDLTDQDFVRLWQYIQKNYGINLSKKKQLISSRLTNWLMQEGYTSFHDYTELILGGKDQAAITAMLNRLTTNYTYFLREKEHFDFLEQVVLPELKKKHMKDRSLSIWSAGCSSGEEPYTISMYLREYFGADACRWDLRVLASDISQNILNSAMHPVYGTESIRKLPSAWQKKYFLPRPDGNYTIAPVIRDNVIFRTFNLMDTPHWKRPFDLIFCRNVMIYFDQPTKDALVKRFYDVTLPEGYLFIGHSEGLNKANCPYQYIMPAIYQKKA
jgi:chemotaxis protein methyltransferase CheR